MEFYEKALEYWQRAQNLNGISKALNNIGVIHMNTGKYPAALEAFRKSVNATGDDQITDTDVLANIGLVYMELNEFEKALKCLQKSFLLTNEKDGHVALDIAKVYRVTPDHTRSLEWAKRSLGLLEPTETRLFAVANTLAAQAAFQNGRHDEALSFANASIAFNEKLRPAGRIEDSQELFERSLEPYYVKAEILALRGQGVESLAVYERARSKALIDTLRYGRAERERNATVSERSNLASLDSDLRRLNAEIAVQWQRKSIDTAKLASLEQMQRTKRAERDALEAIISAGRQHPTTTTGEPPPFDIARIAPLIDEKTVVLEYMVGDHGKTVLYAVSKDGPLTEPSLHLFILPDDKGEESGIDLVNKFRSAVEKGDLGFADRARKLYRHLITPAERLLKNKSRIIIVPDAGLWDVPFQALMDEKNSFLVERAAVSYAPSLTALSEMSRKPKADPTRRIELLAFGNPTIAKETAERSKKVFMNARLEPIPEAERLVIELGRLYGASRTKIFIGNDAREETAKRESNISRIIQFATHGVINDRSPMYSHLVLAQGQNNLHEDGLLEAWELKNLDLSADIVILSACETARGMISSGEGMIGMTWAVFIAGAPTTVASQWKVESSSTTEFMLEFHRQMLANKKTSKAEALRRASLKLMKTTKYRHPSYWAPWVLVGDGS
jgi:CHAT domain-containing protein